MCDKRNWNAGKENPTGEINTRNDGMYIEHSSFGYVHENAGTSSTKPFDTSLMTGNSSNNNSNNGNKR